MFKFNPNRENNTLTIQREFSASRNLLWDYYTKQSLLEQWFAPQPMSTNTQSMDFREGGHWHYKMIDADGTEYWGITQYKKIHPTDQLTFNDAFCDEAGKINTDIPSAEWNITFTEKGDQTLVQSVLTFQSPAALEQVLEMGMEDGMKLTYATLDKLVAGKNV